MNESDQSRHPRIERAHVEGLEELHGIGGPSFTEGERRIEQPLVDRRGYHEVRRAVESLFNATPALVDVNGDGEEDLIFWNNTGNLMAIDGPTGSVLWQQGLLGGKVTPASFEPGNAVSTAAIADIAGDGSQRIIVSGADGWLYALNLDGSVYWAIDFQSLLSEPVISDVTGTGDHAILVGADDGNLYWVMQPR